MNDTSTKAISPVHDQDPHATLLPLVDGAPAEQATIALVLVHGRGGSAEGMIPVARAAGALDALLIAPRAAGGSWYPDRFLAPVAANEPYLSSALSAIGRGVAAARAAGIPAHRIVLVGFSQGACLSLEYAARNATRYGGVAAFAGARVGDVYTSANDHGTFDGTPVFLGCSNDDPHIPEARVRESARLFAVQGATVDLRMYDGVGHNIVGDQIDALRAMIQNLRELATTT